MRIVRLLLFLPAGALLAQVAPTASLVGTVTDPSGGSVPDATVVITNSATQFTRQTTTGADGKFSFTLLPVGRYELRVTAQGFAAYEQSGIRLSVDTASSVNVTLAVGALGERVTVTADAAMVATESGTLSQVVHERYIEDLPLNGRNAATLVRMVPGTVNGVGTTTAGYANTSETQAISVNGTRGNEVSYKLDGATHMDNVTNLNAIYPSPDALAEFTVETSNYSAQYGDAAGAVVNVVTRSGSNAFHGSAFEFLRNGALNARNFFAPQHDNLKRNQFGGTLGGPIRRNKLFFFASYEGTYVNNTSFANTAFVPSARMRLGDFSELGKPPTDPSTGKAFPGNRIPASLISPIATRLLEKVPATGDPTGKLLYARPDLLHNHQWLGKLDYSRGRHLISGSFFYVRYDDPGWDADGTILTVRIGQLQTTRNWKFQDVYTIRPNLINTLVGAVLVLDSYNVKTSRYSIHDFGQVNIARPAGQFDELELGVTGYGGWGGVTNSPPGEWIRNNVEFSDTVSYMQGKHTLQAGVEVTPFIKFDSTTGYQTSGNYSFSGQFTGNGIADLLLGKASTFQQTAGKFKRTRGKQISLFVEDKIHLLPSLTVNLGLRWDPFFPYHDVLGQVTGYQSGFRSTRFRNAPVGSIFAGDPGFPDGGMYADTNNVAPRVSFAWSPSKNSHPTTVRGGYGIFFVKPFPRIYNNFVENAPFSPSVTLNGVDLADPYGSAGGASPFPPFAPVPLVPDAKFVTPTALAYFDPHWNVGYSQAWNFTVEHQLLANLLLRAAYVGNKGTHLQSYRERNPAIYRPGATLRDTDARRPLYPNYASVKEMVHAGNSVYHSFQFTLEKRFSRNFSLLAFYTFSKSIDDESVNNQFTLANPNPYDPRFNRGLSDYDVPHNFRLTGIYDLPSLAGRNFLLRHALGGWSATEILDWRSGTPFGLSSGRDNSFSGIGLDRADLSGDPRLSMNRPEGAIIQRYFDTSLVQVNAVGTFGNSPRNFLRNPRFFNVDFGVNKSFQPLEKLRLEVRGEFFNLFNNTHLNQPGTNVSAASTFGVINGADAPRIVQLGLRLVW